MHRGDIIGRKKDIDDKIIDFAEFTKRKGQKTGRHTDAISGINVTDSLKDGNRGNLHVGGNVTYNVKQAGKTPIEILPPPDSIGSDSLLKQRISGLFNKIGEERAKRHGKSAYSVMYKNFKSYFGIKNQPWTIIWTWPKACALEITEYLEDKYALTRRGRNVNAWEKGRTLPPRGYLYQKEGELLEHLGLKKNSPEVKSLLMSSFGVDSHKSLTNLDHWLLVKHIECLVDKLENI